MLCTSDTVTFLLSVRIVDVISLLLCNTCVFVCFGFNLYSSFSLSCFCWSRGCTVQLLLNHKLARVDNCTSHLLSVDLSICPLNLKVCAAKISPKLVCIFFHLIWRCMVRKSAHVSDQSLIRHSLRPLIFLDRVVHQCLLVYFSGPLKNTWLHFNIG